MASDPASRKWQLTFNNPLEHGWTHEAIREQLRTFKSMCYWCMADEIGAGEQTPHTHLFINLSPSNCRFSTLKNKFPEAHIEKVLGTSRENRDYILKDGKWKDTEKGTTSVPGTFEEFGECPEEHQGKSGASSRIIEMLKDGATNLEVLEAFPEAMKMMDKVERTRSILRDQQFATAWRDVDVTYIYGETGAGKTRSVVEAHGYSNLYRVTDYKHPFDTYDGQDVIIFEEFRSGLRHGDMLNYLDGHPVLLPCRYFNRPACFTKVYIITNIPPDAQYMNIDTESKKAFYRRIKRVKYMSADGVKVWESIDDFLSRTRWVGNHDISTYIPVTERSHSTL